MSSEGQRREKGNVILWLEDYDDFCLERRTWWSIFARLTVLRSVSGSSPTSSRADGGALRHAPASNGRTSEEVIGGLLEMCLGCGWFGRARMEHERKAQALIDNQARGEEAWRFGDNAASDWRRGSTLTNPSSVLMLEDVVVWLVDVLK